MTGNSCQFCSQFLEQFRSAKVSYSFKQRKYFVKTPVHCLSCLGSTVVNTLPTILCNRLTNKGCARITHFYSRAVGKDSCTSFVRYVNPISTRGQIMSTTLLLVPPPGFSDLPPALLHEFFIEFLF